MTKPLDLDDCLALLKHYDIDVAEGHLRKGTSIVIAGTSVPDDRPVIHATIGTHTAHRMCPVTDFLATGLIEELGDSHLTSRPQLSHAVAHLIVKLSHMQVDSALNGFSLTATIEGDHYEVLPKTATIEASSKTVIPHRLNPHAHDDRGDLHYPRPQGRTGG